ncbi:MAG: glycosyltransferase family 1 protein [Lysobacterales bacterium]|jgi:alpha-1,6-mannosyltransferase|nr:MAG: glycosyltransferase family 1 protein [Xanthomonadales bacterium]
MAATSFTPARTAGRPVPFPDRRPAPHLVDVTLFFAPTSGGVRRYLLAKHEWLARARLLDHTILVPGPADTGLPRHVVTFRSPAAPFGHGYRLPLRMEPFREQLRALKPDLIEVGDPYQLAWQSLRVARELGVPIVAFCHSDLATLSRTLLGAWSSGFARRYLANLYARFDRVLAPSTRLAERLTDAGVPGVEIQPLGVDDAVFRPRAADPRVRAALGIPPGDKVLVFAGRLSPEKHVRILLEAMGRLGAGWHLLLVGSGRRARLAANVTQVNYQQEPAELARVLASCDAFVHAGDQETFGLVVLEAMACGLPVVAARAGALPELVDEDVGGTFTPGDPDSLVAAVCTLFERELATVRRAARRRAESRSWDAAFRSLTTRYLGLVAGSVVDGGRREAWRHAG